MPADRDSNVAIQTPVIDSTHLTAVVNAGQNILGRAREIVGRIKPVAQQKPMVIPIGRPVGSDNLASVVNPERKRPNRIGIIQGRVGRALEQKAVLIPASIEVVANDISVIVDAVCLGAGIAVGTL